MTATAVNCAIDAADSKVCAEPAMSWPLRACIVFALIATTMLARFGIDVGGQSITVSIVALYALFAVLVLSRQASIDPGSLLLYGGMLLVAYISLFLNANIAPVNRSSTTSLLLLIALYLPFVVTVRETNNSHAQRRWTHAAFGNVALFCAFAGIAQFFAQFVFNPPWLFNFAPLIPEPLRASGVYNTVISVGSLYKSNGFFFREPSAFSFLMALAVIMELSTARRWLRIGTFAFALLLTYSGTGLLALVIGLMFPLGLKSAGRLLALSLIGLLLVALLGDALNLSFTLNRVQEFDSERSSAYYRYIAPVYMIADSIGSSTWSAVFGHGPGSIQRTVNAVEAFDPTWAKLLFEYGLAGACVLTALVVRALIRSDIHASPGAVLFFSWLIMGGHLLSPDNISMLYVLACLWRPPMRAGRIQGGRQTTAIGSPAIAAEVRT